MAGRDIDQGQPIAARFGADEVSSRIESNLTADRMPP